MKPKVRKTVIPAKAGIQAPIVIPECFYRESILKQSGSPIKTFGDDAFGVLLVLSFLLCLGLAPLFAQPASVQLRVEVGPQEAYIGDIIQYRLNVVYSSSVAPAPLSLPDPLGEFELVDYKSLPPEILSDGKLSLTHVLSLTTFSTGTQKIPSLTLNFTTPKGEQAEANTQEVPVKIRSLLEEKGDLGNIRPLKGLFNFKSHTWVWVLLGLAAFVALVFLGHKVLSKKKGPIVETGPRKPPEVTAWEGIHALEDSNDLSEGRFREFYFSLSTVLRTYLENRYQMSALDRTTSELLSELRLMTFSSDEMGLLRTFFGNGDLVKFAKFTPTEEDADEDLNRVKKFVTITTPEKVPEKNSRKEEKVPV